MHSWTSFVVIIPQLFFGPVLKGAETSIAFPLTFLNKGYGEDIVEGITIKTTNLDDGSVKLLRPVIELDLQRLMQSKKGLNIESSTGTFAPFVVQSKASINKTILFVQVSNNPKYPASQWAPGNHRFDVYGKVSSSSKPKLLKSISCRISSGLLTSYYNGITQFIMQDQASP